MASSFWTFSRQALVPRLFRDYSPSLDRGQAGAHRTQLPDELLTSKSWFILLIRATTAHLEGVDVDLAEPITVLVPGVFASTMTDGLVAVAETRKPGVDAILVSIDVRAFGDTLLDDRVDGRLLDIGQHPDHHLAAALDHAEDRRLLLRQGAASAATLQSVAPAVASFGPHRLGIALVPSDDVELVELNVAAQDHLGCRRHDAVAQPLGHGLGVALTQTQFLRDLTVRQVHPHEVRAQDPGRDRLMMSGQNGSRQVIEAILTCLAQVSLPVVNGE